MYEEIKIKSFGIIAVLYVWQDLKIDPYEHDVYAQILQQFPGNIKL